MRVSRIPSYLSMMLTVAAAMLLYLLASPTIAAVEPTGAQLAIDGYGGCAIASDSRLVCWGEYREHAPKEDTFTHLEAFVFGPRSPAGTMCALSSEGMIRCWQQGGEVGLVPEGNYIAIDADGSSLCYVIEGGAIDCISALSNYYLLSAPLARYIDVALSFGYACGLTSDGSVRCFAGWNRGNYFSALEGVPVGKEGYVQVRAYGSNFCALTSSGGIECWGNDPVIAPPTGDNYVWLDETPCAVTKAGGFECWNEHGSEVFAKSGYSHAARYASRICGVKTDGSLDCFGSVDGGVIPSELSRPGSLMLFAGQVSSTGGSNVGSSTGSPPSGDASGPGSVTSGGTETTHRVATAARLAGSTGGRVSSSVQEVTDGQSVTLTALPNPGFRFLRWEGDASGNRNPVTLTLFDHAFVTAVFAPIEEPTETSQPSVDGRIIARLLADGRIEFGFEPEGGERLLPRSRYFPTSAGGSWLASSSVELNGEQLGRITARRLADGRVEFGFIAPDGERILPSSRYFPASASVDRWLRSSVIGVE